jgi:hypothetical protein
VEVQSNWLFVGTANQNRIKQDLYAVLYAKVQTEETLQTLLVENRPLMTRIMMKALCQIVFS